MEIDDPPPLPDNVMVEVRLFILGCSAKPVETSGVASLYSPEQAQLAMHLLRTLPCARSAVFEYLCNVFDEAVRCHLVYKNTRGNSNQSTSDLETLNSVVARVESLLLDFVSTNPLSWAPIVSAWSIELLGQISSKYSQQFVRGANASNVALQEMFQVFTTCPSSASLLEITSRCVSTLIASCPDLCVNELLNTSVRHAPAFDWVVAHVGSRYPRTIISRVINVGLRDFCTYHCRRDGLGGGAKREPGAPGPTAVKQEALLSAKMSSVTGILNYLATRGHKGDIHLAFHSMFQDSLSPLDAPDEDDGGSAVSLNLEASLQLATLPYLLHLASLSPALWKILAPDLVASFSKPATLRQLAEHIETWLAETLIIGYRQQLLALTVRLICQTDDSLALDIYDLLLRTADPESFTANDEDDDDADDEAPFVPDVVRGVALTILDHLMLTLQRRVHASFKDRADVPFLIALKPNWSALCQTLTRESGMAPRLESGVVRLLSYLALQSESLMGNVVSHVLLDSQTPRKALLFFAVVSGVQTATAHVMSVVLQGFVESLLSLSDETVVHRALVNLDHILRAERVNNRLPSSSAAAPSRPGLMPLPVIRECLRSAPTLAALARVLAAFPSARVLSRCLRLLLVLGLNRSSMASSTLLAAGVAINFFKLASESSSSAAAAAPARAESVKTMRLCSQFLARLCQRSPSIRAVVLRALLEGCLSKEFGNLFSTPSERQSPPTISDSSRIGGHSFSTEPIAAVVGLKDDNLSLPARRSGRSLPSGVIGEGLRRRSSDNAARAADVDDDAARKFNKAVLMETFYRCCCNQELEDLAETSSAGSVVAPPKKPPRLAPSKAAATSLSHLLVDLVSPDVLSNGVAWPEEDAVRHTVERDLTIKKRLQEHEVIIDILDLVAKGGAAALLPSMVILRAWTAALILFWDSNRDSNPGAASSTWYYGASLRLIRIMAVGNLLPHPLAHSDELFEFTAPFERYLLLANIWRFMKEVPLAGDADDEAIEARLRDVDPKFVEVMRSVLNANIAGASHLFGFLFPADSDKMASAT